MSNSTAIYRETTSQYKNKERLFCYLKNIYNLLFETISKFDINRYTLYNIVGKK